MNKLTVFAILIAILTTTTFSSCDKEDVDDDPKPISAREQAIKDYEDNYLGSKLTDPGWNGVAASCDEGTVSQESHDKVIQRINYFRTLVGLDTCSFSGAYNLECQEAALIMNANNQLSHYPPSGWYCHSPEGADGAGNSNIALSSGGSISNALHAVNAVSAYMDDFGANNLAVGHRRWFIYSKAKVIGGHGSTDRSNAIWVSGNENNPSQAGLEFIAYPPKGYIPNEVCYDRWSFAVPDADFKNTTISMTDSIGNNVPLNIIYREEAGGSYIADNTIVWEPQGVITNSTEDVKYNVTVSDYIVGGTPTTSTYEVIIVRVAPEFKKKEDKPKFQLGEAVVRYE